MTEAALRYFATPGPTTDLNGYSDLIHELPSNPKALARIVRLYERSGEQGKAATWREKLEAARAGAKKR